MARRGSRFTAGVAAAVVLALLFPGVADGKKRRRGRAARREPPIAALTREGLPNVQAASALVVDIDSGTLVYAKNPDLPRPIASTSKIFVAMAVRRRGLDLDGATEITPEDRREAMGGARTHLYEHERYGNLDLMKAMLIASDNRAPHALARAVGMSSTQMVAELNALARGLGLEDTVFTDVSGLNGNTSTARDMAVALRAFLKDPLLAEIASTRFTSIVSIGPRPKRVNYANTNRLLHSDRNHILAGKTGYTDEALYCLVVASEIEGRRLATVILGAYGELTRYGDYARIQNWLTQGRPLPPGPAARVEAPEGPAPDGLVAPTD